MSIGFSGEVIAVATLHGKAEALAPALAHIGLEVVPVPIDTDALGTFAGDVERPGNAREVVIEKARRGMRAAGCSLGIATEGSFGPDPVLGFLPRHEEVLAFVDDLNGQVIVIEHVGHDTNWVSKAVRPGDDLAPWLLAIGLPSHAALVKPHRWPPERSTAAPGIAATRADHVGVAMPVAKGLVEPQQIAAAIERIAVASADGLARLEADLRAHMNPTRMRVIAHLGDRLRQRLATPCPACKVPGFGRVAVEPGLPCELCGGATDLVRTEIHGCGVCGHREDRPRSDGLTAADAGHCPDCNP